MKIDIINKKFLVYTMVPVLAAATVGCSGPKDRPGPSGSGRGNPPSKEQILAEHDKNQDGKLSMDEFPGPDDHFSRFDTNSDGYLEINELPDGPPAEKRRR